ncbi:single-stranded DNA-binding protein [Campylobacter sp. TTU-622]|uniref:single-stranded DNA-binding protein n=1 Tax=Campylobacter sp. TTU-622 TaxID=2800583 RepID=UPI001799D37B|nr:single-stranded DNA-binding protein [Campylobacter sp. TTU-622]EAI8568543.1 single-stranded DNA-binding protein [Campylobacter jejuni]EFS0701717.1 single-stranded DNA-binding protein [Campylobacter jejuni]EHS1057277.1 single-stranded DNA-binding protein [Campylobacter jejuni]EHS1059162.1 single-stranded DNA-binding protein [Campylobacter jejuni]EHS1060913.1 single-stranded DNA-binding protein [Campylobacter jejuni]
MNQVNLCGYLCKDFEIKYTPKGSAFAKTTLAVSENRRNKENGEYETQTSWIPLILFGRRAEVAHQYLKKGDRFLGTGKIVTSAYSDQNGNVRYGWQVVISSFEFIEKKGEQNQNCKVTSNPNQITPPKEVETMPSIDENQADGYIEENENLPF